MWQKASMCMLDLILTRPRWDGLGNPPALGSFRDIHMGAPIFGRAGGGSMVDPVTSLALPILIAQCQAHWFSDKLNLLSHAQKTSPQKLSPPKQGNARGTSKASAPLVRPWLHLPLATPPSALTSRGLRDNANPAPNESAPGIHRPTTKNAQPRAAAALPARRGAIGPLPRSGRR
jgi:hypothetical protein